MEKVRWEESVVGGRMRTPSQGRAAMEFYQTPGT